MAGCNPRIPTPYAPRASARVVSALVITCLHVVAITQVTGNMTVPHCPHYPLSGTSILNALVSPLLPQP